MARDPLHCFSPFYLVIPGALMKLTIIKLDSLSSQDLLDLAKIWPRQSPGVWQQWLTPEQMIFAARFNDRLLAAVKVSVRDSQAKLDDLCVREVTRRRGVGLYLLEILQQQLPKVAELTMDDIAEDAGLAAFMRACGFKLEENVWRKSRN